MPAELRFAAMGTWAHIVAVGAPSGAVERARERIAQLEARWSRFRPDSEVSRLNRAAGRTLVVSSDTLILVGLALSGWTATEGRFDPTVLGSLLDAGYDRSFERLRDTSASTGTGTGAGSMGAGGVVVDERRGTVTLPTGVGFDPGAIGKGLAADLTVASMLAEGAHGACVSLGGDLRAEGRAPGGGPWVVDVADPFRVGADDPLGDAWPVVARLAFDAGGLATSSPLRRSWTVGGEQRHHLIDPGTGQPAETDVAAVTVLAGDAWRAEVLATAAVLAGVGAAAGVLENAGATGLVIDGGGAVHRPASLEPFAA